MKCIIKNKKVKRVKDYVAQDMVDHNGWAYCAKYLWKAVTRKNKKRG